LIKNLNRKIRLADLGTGSGVIGLSLASELPRGSSEVWLTDVSSDALDVARANLAGSGLLDGDVRVAEGNWLEAFVRVNELSRNCFDLIVSNPPYIARGDSSVESVVGDYEPHVALFAGDDGLDAYREIVPAARDWLVSGGWLVFEIGHDQGDALRRMLEQNRFKNIEIRQDLALRDRIAIGQK
jgi:release factor glutamine methyltransferase